MLQVGSTLFDIEYNPPTVEKVRDATKSIILEVLSLYLEPVGHVDVRNWYLLKSYLICIRRNACAMHAFKHV